MKRIITLFIVFIFTSGLIFSQAQPPTLPQTQKEKKVSTLKKAAKDAKTAKSAKTKKTTTKRKTEIVPVPAEQMKSEVKPPAAPAINEEELKAEPAGEKAKEVVKEKVEKAKEEAKGEAKSAGEEASKEVDKIKTK